MATKLYFTDDFASNSVSGTLPSGEQSAATASVSGTATPFYLSTVIGGASSSGASLSSLASATQQKDFFRTHCTLPLDGTQTVGNGTVTLAVVGQESSLNANLVINALHIFSWRPSTGAKIATLVDQPNSLSFFTVSEPGAINKKYQMVASLNLSPGFSVQDGDVIVVEVWGVFTQDSATSYTVTFWRDGNTEPTIDGAVVDPGVFPASYISFPETIVFDMGIESGDGAAVCVLTGAATGSMIRQGVGAASMVLTAAGAALNYVSGAGAATCVLTVGGVGRGINPGVGAAAMVIAVTGVWDESSIVNQGVGATAISFEGDFVGAEFFPHIFLQELPVDDVWTFEEPHA